ncbi:MAG: RNA-directed DNA polymerase [Calothrix sp. SM1_7_51]|nr:RNA-directed DNA polymerase [Calothrix sp. SM1_7_51]
MKRHGNLYHKITDWDNLQEAAAKAQKGKTKIASVAKFNSNLEAELLKIQQELVSKTYQPGEYKTFQIVDPKPRIISAAPYRDRVVHNALIKIIAQILEKSFIPDSYANRKGFGTHRALRRFIYFARTSRYVLQCDIKKYFPSINHEILKIILRNKIKCPDTLWLIDLIIDNSNPQELENESLPGDEFLTPSQIKRGLPIGNLTSQLYGNVYLNGFDHFVKETLRVKKYVRYVDDFALFSDDKEFLEKAKIAIEEYLSCLRLEILHIKSQLCETKHGATFLGFRVLPDRIRVRTHNLRRGRKRLRRLQRECQAGQIQREDVHRSVKSWFAHLAHGDTWRLREKIVSDFGLFP